jgi:hypothetical protein
MKQLVILIGVTLTGAFIVLAACPADGSGNHCTAAQNGSSANPGAVCGPATDQSTCRDVVRYVQCQGLNAAGGQ